jgi:diguanylate cyclase (GGDEF)-like protein/PAS domain S-box-containing protein
MELPWNELIENMPVGFAYRRVVRDQDGKMVDSVFLLVNKAYEEITGLKREDLLGKTRLEAVPAIREDSIPWARIFEEVVEGQKSQTFEQFSRVMGRTFHVTAFPVSKDAFATVFFDISEMTALRIRMQEKQQELEELNLALYKESITDPGTKLFNRRYILELLNKEVARAERNRHPLSIALVDIDFFKRINDTYGHLAGDEVLEQFSRRLQQWIREMDFVGRYGGEEFLLIFPETTGYKAARVLERIRWQMESVPFVLDGQEVKITFSAGVAGYAGEAVHQFLLRMDGCLYRAKDQGRNRVLCSMCDKEA